jgi:hypothetical protein
MPRDQAVLYSSVEKCQQDQSLQCHSYDTHITPSGGSIFFKGSTGVLLNAYEAHAVRGYDISEM